MAKDKGRTYTHLLVVNADRKMVNGITFVRLPDGPSIYFSVTSYEPREDIKGSGQPTSHIPELVLNNFSSTQLGWSVGRMFQSLWPTQPELEGRQVVTLHNQRDYIFFRRHRYEFKNEKRVNLQELGPRFTLKTKRVEKGIWDFGLLTRMDGEVGQVEWEWHPRMEKDRKQFYL
jgi:ribosome production factor 1